MAADSDLSDHPSNNSTHYHAQSPSQYHSIRALPATNFLSVVGSGIRPRHILRVGSTRLPTAHIFPPVAHPTFSRTSVGIDKHRTHRIWRIIHIRQLQDLLFRLDRQQYICLFNGARVRTTLISNISAHPSDPKTRFRKGSIYIVDIWRINSSLLAHSAHSVCSRLKIGTSCTNWTIS